MRYVFLILLCLTISVAAEESKPDAYSRLSNSLGQCVGLLESRNDQVYDLQKKLDFANAEIKTLKEKSNAEQKPSAGQDNGSGRSQP